MMKLALAVLLAFALAAGTALAHSGGTDVTGCHAGTEPYHCH